MRSALNLTISAIVVISSAFAASAAPVNKNSSSNSAVNVNGTTKVFTPQQSINGSLVEVGTQASNNAQVGINQNSSGSGLNIGSNQNSQVNGNNNTKKTGNYFADFGSTIRSQTFVTNNSDSKINQTNSSAFNKNSPQNASIGFGSNVNIGGNNTAIHGGVINRGVGIESTTNTQINQNSSNPVNKGAAQNTKVNTANNFVSSGNNFANGGVINSQTVSNTKSNIVINSNR